MGIIVHEIKEHSFFCKEDNEFGRVFCEANESHFLFYYGLTFFLIKYRPCCESIGHLHFKQDLISKSLKAKEPKKHHGYRNHLSEDFFEVYGNETDVCYIYHDMCGKRYCISALSPKEKDFEKMAENYNEMKEYLSNNDNLSYLLDELEIIYKINKTQKP